MIGKVNKKERIKRSLILIFRIFAPDKSKKTMLLSMTGFGKAVATAKDKKITVEIKSLNSKQLDLNMRMPYSFRSREMDLRALCAAKLERGKVDFTVSVENLAGAPAGCSSLNAQVIEAYKKQIDDISYNLGISTPADWWEILLRLPDAVHTEAPADADAEQISLLDSAAAEALDALWAHRRAEGEQLELFFAERVAAIAELLKQVEPFEKERVEKVRARLEDNLARIPGVEYDRSRLEQELIFYIEKLDINEEKQRLTRHLAYFLETMAAKSSQGKKLGFIAQEMGREINTMGSKSNQADMQAIVVKMKDLLEQIKEQVLNVL